MNIFYWFFIWNSKVFIHENVFENVVCTILFRARYVNGIQIHFKEFWCMYIERQNT